MTSGADGAGVTPEADGADTEPTPLLLAARRAMNPNGDGLSEVATLPTVDEQLAAMGLADDTERLYRKMFQEGATDRGAAAGKARAGDVAPAYSPTPDPSAGRPHPASNRTTTPDSGAGRPHAAGNRTTTPDPRVGRPHAAGNRTTTPDPGAGRPHAADNRTTTPDPGVGRPHAAGNRTTTPDPGVGRPHAAGNRTTTPDPSVGRPHVAGDRAPGASPERGLALPPGRLTLGPFASAPAGKTLAGFVEAVESGDVLALGLLFDGRARHRGERGIDDITAHYRALFGRTRARAVDLRLLKLERDGDTTRVEAQLTLRGVSDGTIKTLEDGRVEFELDDNDPPRILRLQAIRD